MNEALGHHTSIESGGEEPCRERRIPVREGVSDQRMSLCCERADLGRRSVERRCFAEARFRRKPCRKPVCTPRRQQRPIMPAIVRQRAGTSGVDQTCWHAGAALQRAFQLAPGRRRGRFGKQFDDQPGEFGHGSAEIVVVQAQLHSGDPCPSIAAHDGVYDSNWTTDVGAGPRVGWFAEERRPVHQYPPSQCGAVLGEQHQIPERTLGWRNLNFQGRFDRRKAGSGVRSSAQREKLRQDLRDAVHGMTDKNVGHSVGAGGNEALGDQTSVGEDGIKANLVARAMGKAALPPYFLHERTTWRTTPLLFVFTVRGLSKKTAQGY